jgi:hypothetical protein
MIDIGSIESIVNNPQRLTKIAKDILAKQGVLCNPDLLEVFHFYETIIIEQKAFISELNTLLNACITCVKKQP